MQRATLQSRSASGSRSGQALPDTEQLVDRAMFASGVGDGCHKEEQEPLRPCENSPQRLRQVERDDAMAATGDGKCFVAELDVTPLTSARLEFGLAEEHPFDREGVGVADLD